MLITLFGNTSGYAARRLQEEALHQGITLQLVPISSLVLTVSNDSFLLSCREYGDVSQSDCYIFRGIGSADQEMMTIAKHLSAHGRTIIEEKTATGALLMDKLFLQATDTHVPTPSFQMIQSQTALEEIASSLSYPKVMKSTIGSMGKNVALVHNTEELFEKFLVLGPRVIIQDYFQVDHDIRAIVIGGKYIGAYKRTRTDGEFRMNRPGNNKEAIDLPEVAISICEHASSSQNIEIAGVDLFEYQGRWYVLEVNTAPQFAKFEEYTKTNVAKLIIDYAVQKVINSQSNTQ